ncbi:MAG: chondroitinase-B domain-containing protein [Verrucomicrobiales bacterium]|nr:chondroitinase-B domain-containing protein [Verrucomicrobiales bacterium]
MKWFIICATFSLSAFTSARELTVFDSDELKKAARSAVLGDVIVLAEKGNWTDVQLKLEMSDITLTVEKRGNVCFRGQSSLEIIGRNLLIDGLTFRDGFLDDGHVLRVRGEHCRITRCSIIGYNPQKLSTRYHWLSLHGNNHRVDHCRFSEHNHSGTTICVWLEDEGAGHHRIDHNLIGPRAKGKSNGFEAMRTGTSEVSMKSAKCIVTKNLFIECDGEIETVSNKSCGNMYIANTFDRCAGCLTLRHGNDCVVAHNIILGGNKKGTGGIRVIGENHVVRNNHIEGTQGRADGAISISAGVVNPELNQHSQVKNLAVEGNTLFDNKGGNFCIGHGMGSHNRTLLPVDVKIHNNREESTPTTRCGHRLTAGDVGPDSVISPHPKATPGTHSVGEVDNLDRTAWTIPSPQSAGGIVLDETAAVLEGEWQYSTHTPPWVGIGYLHDRKEGKGKKSVTWEFSPPQTGRYRVEISHCYNVRRATNTPVTIVHADGEKTIRINQQEEPPENRLFRSLGEFRFEKDRPGTIQISNAGTSDNKVVIADALRFVPLGN